MDEFFLFGIASLQALTILREIKHDSRLTEFALGMIYTASTISSLGQAIVCFHDERKETQNANQAKMRLSQADILQHYKNLIDQLPKSTTVTMNLKQQTVILWLYRCVRFIHPRKPSG